MFNKGIDSIARGKGREMTAISNELSSVRKSKNEKGMSLLLLFIFSHCSLERIVFDFN